MPRQSGPYLPAPRPLPPSSRPPIVIDAGAGYPYPEGPYPPPADPGPAYPPSPYGLPQPARSVTSRRLVAVLFLAALVGGGFWLASKQPPVTSRPAQSREAFKELLESRDDPPPWFKGEWAPENGADVPRLELRSYGSAVTGRLVLAWTGSYVMSLPLLAGESNETTVLFKVEGRPPHEGAQFYVLEQGTATATLYHLNATPFGLPHTASALPRNLAKKHAQLATLVRRGAGGKLRHDPIDPKTGLAMPLGPTEGGPP